MQLPPLRQFPLLATFVLSISGHSAVAADTQVKEDSFEPVIRLFQADSQSVLSFYDLPWSGTRRSRLEQFYAGQLATIRHYPFHQLAQAGKVDFLLLQTELHRQENHLRVEQKQFDQMKELLPGKQTIDELELKRWRLEPLDFPVIAQSVSEIPSQIKKLTERLEAGRKKEKKEAAPLTVSPAVALRAAAALGQIRSLFQSWFKFYDGFQPEFSWWIQKPYQQAATALVELEKFLREEIAGAKGKDEDPLVGDPIGAEMLASELAAEWIPYSPAELIRIAEKEFTWCEDQLKIASREMHCGEDWKQALARVKSDFASPGRQKDVVAEQAREAIEFVRTNDLVTVPPLCAETWRLAMISPEGQKNLPFAAYRSQNILVAYASSEMSNEEKLMSMRGNNRHFTRIVVGHELIPGHHLQVFQAARHRNYRSLFATPFLTEGWAQYWEMRLWDLGYGRTPEDRIGMLFWRMHRAARIIVSLKFHLGEMRPEQMVDFLVDKVGHERSGATAEVRRFISGGYSPLYQCAYMIGGLQLKRLEDEVRTARSMSEKEFHDAVLAENAIPIELIRAEILKLPLQPDSAPGWKFYNDH